MEPAELAEALASPAAYPFHCESVDVLETHISRLFFAGARVYKVKKPVDLGFLDFSTLERRRHFCEEEVRLNRRLAGDTYLGVVPIARAAGGALAVGGEGEVVEYAVEMRCLPAARMLERLLDEGAIDNELLGRLAERLAEFHAAASTGEGVDGYGAPDAVAGVVEGNVEELVPFTRTADGAEALLSPALHAFLLAHVRAFLRRERGLLEERVVRGRIRDGHGDLHAGNVCATADELVIYDALEFSSALRCGDVALDLAFLAMDLDQRGFPGFARWLVRRYAELAGEDVAVFERLVAFYSVHRALVRAKVAAIGAGQRDEEGRRALERAARRYFALAVGYGLGPALVLTCGLPGVGKTHSARELARPLRAVVLRSDVRRRVVVGAAVEEESWREGAFSPEQSERTYGSLLESAREAIAGGRTVIVDATFGERARRAPFVEAAARLRCPLYVLHVTAPRDVALARLERRASDPHEDSQAGPEVHLRMARTFERPDELPRSAVVAAESPRDPPEAIVARLLERRVKTERSG